MLEFDEEQHQYRIDGAPVPSVTQLVAPLGEDISDDLEITVEIAAERGTQLHAYIAHRLQDGAPEDFELPGSYGGYVDAIELFLAEHPVYPYLVETALAGNGYAGTPDLICSYGDGEIAILDWKFVSQIAKSKVGAQLAGYMELCNTNGLFPDTAYAVQFLSSGSYRVYPVDMGEAYKDFELCKDVYEARTKKHPRGRIA